MNKKKSIWSGVSVLIAAVLAIVAFVRSDTQIWLLTAAFTIWAIWVTAAFVFPYIPLPALWRSRLGFLRFAGKRRHYTL